MAVMNLAFFAASIYLVRISNRKNRIGVEDWFKYHILWFIVSNCFYNWLNSNSPVLRGNVWRKNERVPLSYGGGVKSWVFTVLRVSGRLLGGLAPNSELWISTGRRWRCSLDTWRLRLQKGRSGNYDAHWFNAHPRNVRLRNVTKVRRYRRVGQHDTLPVAAYLNSNLSNAFNNIFFINCVTLRVKNS